MLSAGSLGLSRMPRGHAVVRASQVDSWCGKAAVCKRPALHVLHAWSAVGLLPRSSNQWPAAQPDLFCAHESLPAVSWKYPEGHARHWALHTCSLPAPHVSEKYCPAVQSCCSVRDLHETSVCGYEASWYCPSTHASHALSAVRMLLLFTKRWPESQPAVSDWHETWPDAAVKKPNGQSWHSWAVAS